MKGGNSSQADLGHVRSEVSAESAATLACVVALGLQRKSLLIESNPGVIWLSSDTLRAQAIPHEGVRLMEVTASIIN